MGGMNSEAGESNRLFPFIDCWLRMFEDPLGRQTVSGALGRPVMRPRPGLRQGQPLPRPLQGACAVPWAPQQTLPAFRHHTACFFISGLRQGHGDRL